jgi:hypothetical protein
MIGESWKRRIHGNLGVTKKNVEGNIKKYGLKKEC